MTADVAPRVTAPDRVTRADRIRDLAEEYARDYGSEEALRATASFAGIADAVRDAESFFGLVAEVAVDAAPHMTMPALLQGVADLVAQLATLHDLDGDGHWSGINPELTCVDRDAAAHEEQERAVRDALDTLLDGR